MKKLSFTKLTALLLFLIFALVSCTPNNAVSSDTSSADDTSEKRFFNSNNDGWCVDPGAYRNIYNGAPDIPPVGSLQLTPLAAYLTNTAEDGEEMYFIVGVTASKNSSGTPKGWSKEDLMSFVYNGKTVGEYLSSFEYPAYCKDNSTYPSYASWEILSANLYIVFKRGEH